jgi:hypothetical protein
MLQDPCAQYVEIGKQSPPGLPECLSYESHCRDFSEKKSPLAAHFIDEAWVAKLAYLCDIFNLLNELNRSLQGRMTTVFKLADKVAAFKAKLELWGRRVDRGIFDVFQTLAGISGDLRLGRLSPSWCTVI